MDIIKNRAVITIAGVLVGHFLPAVYPWYQIVVAAATAWGG